MLRNSGSNNQRCSIMNTGPSSRMAARMRSASARSRHIGFSTSTCLPAWWKAMEYSAWKRVGVQMSTAS